MPPLHNPIKGEVMIMISGKEYPLVFSFDAIAKIETEFNQTIMDAQVNLGRAEVLQKFLKASTSGAYSGPIEVDVLPPLLICQQLVQRALHIAYFGTEATEQLESEEDEEQEKSDEGKFKKFLKLFSRSK